MNEIDCIDCIEGMRKLPDTSIDVIIADPPYNIGKDFGNNSDEQEIDQYLLWCDKWISECLRLLTGKGSLFIYGFSETLASIFVRIHNHHKKWLVWSYSNKTTPTAKCWIRSHESIIQVSKSSSFIFNQDDVRVPYSKDFSKLNGKKRQNTSGRFGNKETTYNFDDRGALPRDVINIPALAGGAGKERIGICKTCNLLIIQKNKKDHSQCSVMFHPTQKPFALTETLIKSSIDKNKHNVILVPFAGSGSECFVAKKLGLSVIAFEINPDYVLLANWFLNSICE